MSLTGSGVLEHVGQCLLDDAVRGKLHARREIIRYTVQRENDLQTRCAQILDQPGNIGETGLRTERGDFGVGS